MPNFSILVPRIDDNAAFQDIMSYFKKYNIIPEFKIEDQAQVQAEQIQRLQFKPNSQSTDIVTLFVHLINPEFNCDQIDEFIEKNCKDHFVAVIHYPASLYYDYTRAVQIRWNTGKVYSLMDHKINEQCKTFEPIMLAYFEATLYADHNPEFDYNIEHNIMTDHKNKFLEDEI